MDRYSGTQSGYWLKEHAAACTVFWRIAYFSFWNVSGSSFVCRHQRMMQCLISGLIGSKLRSVLVPYRKSKILRFVSAIQSAQQLAFDDTQTNTPPTSLARGGRSAVAKTKWTARFHCPGSGLRAFLVLLAGPAIRQRRTGYRSFF